MAPASKKGKRKYRRMMARLRKLYQPNQHPRCTPPRWKKSGGKRDTPEFRFVYH